MIRTTTCFAAALLGCLMVSSESLAEVYIRAPFFRLKVGRPGVYIRAPFVNINIPRGPQPVYVPRPSYVPPPANVQPSPPIPQTHTVPPVTKTAPQTLPMPKKVAPEPPTPAPKDAEQKSGRAVTLKEFSNLFKPKEGLFEVDLINPINNKATTVRFALPTGTPRRVQVGDRQIEFRYGLRRFVRIEFDEEGAIVTSR